ncbi:MAG TPA: TIGR03618 family F420-dependent PPOX class oxidoreductase [Chloroflexota bacterium]|nr:TIGR03618 family F420-dependent PPOX class oxidoreductase [Chloroflexota bacterium]
MPAQIPASHADLLRPGTKAFAALALVNNQGEPVVTPIWFDYDGQDIVINTARGRVKDRLLSKKPIVALMVEDPNNPYRYIQIRGPVVSETEEGGYAQISALNQKYQGNPNYPKYPGEVRVTYKIRPESVTTMG